MSNFTWGNFCYAVFLVFIAYFILLILYYFVLMVMGFVESVRWERKREGEDYPLSYFSAFNLPVSVVMPACNEELWIEDSVKSVLNLNYPNFELIVVDDGSTDNTFKILTGILDLQATDMVYTRHYKDGQVYDVYKSRNYPNVRVVKKGKGRKKAGAVNAGLNIANYDYICVVDADTILEQDSLLKVMAEVQKDPDRIVGIGSYFGLSNGFRIRNGAIIEKRFSYRPIIAYQNLEYIRSFLGNRIAWSRFDAMPIIAGGFGIWRRDVLYGLGGYSSEFTCEDLEFTFRAHKYIADTKKPFLIKMLPYNVSWTDGPADLVSLIRQRDRWQRVELETMRKYMSMCFNPKYGRFGLLTLPYYFLYEVLGAYFEIVSVAFILLGWLTHVLDLKTFLAYTILMLLCQCIYSITCLFSFIRVQKVFSFRYTVYLVLLSLAEFIAYRWIVSIGKFSGMISYFRGNRIFDQYTRERRAH